MQKLKEGIFVGPHIPKMLKDPDFLKSLTAFEFGALQSFK